LEPDVMEKVQKDILMKWVGSSEDSKLWSNYCASWTTISR
jgi:hypothetical protein